MPRKTESKSAAKRPNEQTWVNKFIGMVCAVREDMTQDQAYSLVQRYYRKGVRDVSQIGFLILLSPDKPPRPG